MNQKQLRLIAALLFVAVVGAIGQSGLPNVALHPAQRYRPLMSGLPIITSGAQADGGACPTLASNNVAYWPLDIVYDAGTADVTENGHDFFALVNVSVDAGIIANALWPLISAGTPTITVGSPPTVAQPGAFTVSLWVKPAASQPNAYAGLIVKSASEGLFLYNTKFSYYLAGNHETTATWTADVWQHVVVAYDGANMVFWVNGVQDNTFTFALTNPWQANKLATAGAPYHLAGLLDEVGVWDRKLTDAEIQCLYNQGSGLYYPFATPATPPAPNGTGLRTNLYRYFDFSTLGLHDGGVPGGNIAAQDLATRWAWTTYNWSFPPYGPGGTGSPIPGGLNTPSTEVTSNTSVTASNTVMLNSFSIAVWANITSPGYATNNNGYGGGIWTHNSSDGLYAGVASSYVFVNNSTPYTFGPLWGGGWQHVVFTYDQFSQDATLIVNGVAAPSQHVGTLRLNGYWVQALFNVNNWNQMLGGLDEFAAWQQRVLTEEEAARLYNYGYGARFSSLTSPSGYAQFNITGLSTFNDYAFRPTDDSVFGLPSDFTISFWIRRANNNLTLSEVAQKFLPHADGGLADGGAGWHIWFDTSSYLHADFSGVALNSANRLYDGTVIGGLASSSELWWHIVLRRSGNTYTMWVNGLVESTTTSATTPSTTTNPLLLGRMAPKDVYTPPNWNPADVSDFAIWSVALSDAEVRAVYNGARPTDYPNGLEGAWYFLGNLQDSSKHARHLTTDGGFTFGYGPR